MQNINLLESAIMLTKLEQAKANKETIKVSYTTHILWIIWSGQDQSGE